jgi:hypothetical protein
MLCNSALQMFAAAGGCPGFKNYMIARYPACHRFPALVDCGLWTVPPARQAVGPDWFPSLFRARSGASPLPPPSPSQSEDVSIALGLPVS